VRALALSATDFSFASASTDNIKKVQQFAPPCVFFLLHTDSESTAVEVARIAFRAELLWP
jgi:hypothetical protein